MYRIMLVDDEKIILQGIRDIIERFSLFEAEFLLCEDGREAWSQFDSFRPHIVFTDVRMPNMDGLALSRSIRERSDELNDTIIVIISGYGDFNYAKTAIACHVFGYLLKPIDKRELYEILQKACARLSAGESDSVSKGDTEMTLLLQEVSKGHHDLTPRRQEAYVLIRIQAEKTRPALSPGRLTDYGPVLEILEVLKPMTIGTRISGNHIYSLLRIDADYCPGDYDFRQYAGLQKNDILLRLLNTGITMCVSGPFTARTAVFDAEKEIEEIRNCIPFLPDSCIYAYSDIRNRTEAGPLELDEVRGILKGIESGNREQIEGHFHLLAAYFRRNTNLSLKYIENVYNDICMEVYKRFYTASMYRKYADYFDFFMNIHKAVKGGGSPVDVHASIRTRILDFCSLYIQENLEEMKRSDTIIAAKCLIQQNYSHPEFSLKFLSEKLHLSSQYLSSLFKRETGISFNDYLSKVRMEQAVELMKDNSLSVTEIGKRVGYFSEKHFFVVFKKYAGMPPARYRRKMGYNTRR